MVVAPIPSHESARLDALHRLQLLDTPSEPAFDELAQLAAYVCRAPIAVISFVDSERQWFKSVVGLTQTESPRSTAFCAHTILGTDPFIVEEADADERFVDHPWVVEPPSIRFYAGVPLITPDGHAIGSLAVMDVVPRALTPEQRAAMQTLATQVMAQLELRKGRASLGTSPVDSKVPAALSPAGELDNDWKRVEGERSKQEMLLTLMLNTGPGCIKRVAEDGTLLQMNPAGLKLIEACSEQDVLGRSVFDLVLPEYRAAFMRMHCEVIQGAVRILQFEILGLQGTRRWVESHAVPFRNPATGHTEHLAMSYDITERKQAEEALRLSQERLQQALGASNTGLWDWNTESGEVSFSKEWKSQLGYGGSELPDSFETWASRLHPDDRDHAILYAQRYRDSPVGAFRQDFRLRHKDGSYRWIDSHASFVTEPDGRRIRLLGSHTDITERKQAEEALSTSERRFRTLAQISPVGIFRTDAAGECRYVNERWCDIAGMNPDDAAGRGWIAALHPDDRERVVQEWEAAANRRDRFTSEYRFQRPDGGITWVVGQAQAELDQEGYMVGYVGTVTDITERKRVEESLRESEERFRAAYHNATVGMSISDLKGRIQEVNHALSAILGYAEQELRNRTFQSLTHPDDLSQNLDRIRRLLQGVVPYDVLEKRYIRKDGGIVWAQVGISVIRDEAGAPSHILAMVQDITERKHVEEALQLAKFTVDRAKDAIYWVGANAELLDVNDAACAMLGYTKEEFRRMTVHDINPYFQADSWPAYWEETRRCGAVLLETFHQTKDGRLIPIEVNVSFLSYQGRECHCAFVRDITERKQSEGALRQSEERFNHAIEATNEGVWDWDITTGVVYFSPQWIRLLGYLPDEVMPSTDFFFSILHPEDAIRTTEVLQAHLDGRTPVKELELRLRQKSGEYRWYFDRGKVVARHRDGHPLRMVGTITDITERKQAEQDRAQALNNLQTIMETVPDVIFALNQEGCLVKWNTRMEVVTGYPSEELQGKPALELVPPEEAAQTAMAIQRAFETGYAELEGHLLTKAGRSIPYHWTGAPFTDLQGRIIGITGVGRDVTERKQTESALRLTRFSIQQAVDAVFWIDAQARILDVNDAACRALGYTREELVSKTVPDIDPNFPPEAWPAHWEELKARKSFSFETDHRRKDGTVIQTETTVNFLIHEGREYNCAFMRDITDRKRAEEALRMTRFSVERVSDAVFWIDAEARILDVNEAACLSLQYSRDELLSMHLFDIDPHVTEDNWARLWQDKLEQRSLTFESSQVRRDGTAFPVEVTCNHLRFGRQEFCCAMVRNISERKDAEGRLKFSEERFRLVAEATNDVLWDWDLVTQEHWWSPNAQEKFGYDPNEEPSIAAWTDRLHADDRDRVMALIDCALASDVRAVAAEYQFRLADGSYGHFYDRGQIVRDSSGRPLRMVGAMIDITFSKRAYVSLEEAYRRLQSMSRELQTVESNERRRLSRELHDEVGQLLTALKFDLEATRQALNEKETVAIVRAQERTLRALQATDELFARLRRVVRALRPSVLEELGLKDALEALVSDVQSRSDLVCSVSVEGEAVRGLAASAIESSLYRMAQELVTNVVRHAQAVTLSVSLEVDLRHWVLTVQDDGIGFNPKAESINGMGVRGVRERAEILGGHVDVRSVSGAGTTIRVWIPVSPIAMPGTGLSGA